MCTEMLWICVLYASFGYKVRPRTFRCIAMGIYFLAALVLVCVAMMVMSSA